MPLSTAKTKLEQDILNAFQSALDTANSPKDQDNSATIRENLARDLCNAIDVYVKSAQVNISSVVSTVPPGVAVTTAGSAVAQVGLTVSPGIAQHAGFGSLQ